MFPLKKAILVTGSNGQLGQELRRLSAMQSQYEFLFTTRETLDITNAKSVELIFDKFRPEFCINCAAYTTVDRAEDEQALAFAINKDGVHNLVIACKKYDSVLINVSTDYVYHSTTGRPIKETDECEPKGVYAISKRQGEVIMEESGINWINLRVSWLYSSFKKNFVKTMLRLGAEKESINVVSDQIGAPTYARDLAEVMIEICNCESLEELSGHYNFANAGQTSWADFARMIFQLSQLDCSVVDISTEQFNAPAPRPEWSVMSMSKIKNAFGIHPKPWQESLESCLQDLATQEGVKMN